MIPISTAVLLLIIIKNRSLIMIVEFALLKLAQLNTFLTTSTQISEAVRSTFRDPYGNQK